MGDFFVTILPTGWSVSVGAGASVLQGLEAQGIVLPSACRNGTCRTCLCRMDSGAVAYLVAWPGVSLDEKRAGWILPCVAQARSDLVLEVPAARRRTPD